MSNLSFRVMTTLFRVRDLVLPRERILAEVPLKTGMQVLDYGCGPGSYSLTAARLVGEKGKVYALDIHPLALRTVTARAKRRELTNIETIQSDCDTGLDSGQIDVAFLYDILHGLSHANDILKEIHRVLKTDGLLSVNDHHQTTDKIKLMITGTNLFQVAHEGKRVINFKKAS